MNDSRLKQLLQMTDAFDLSWSFGRNGVDQRGLLFLPPTKNSKQLLAEFARENGMPETGLKSFLNDAQFADALGVTLTDNGSHRLYAQYWDQLVQDVENGDLSPKPLYVGWKHYAGGAFRQDVYVCAPLAPRSVYWPTLEPALRHFGFKPDALEKLSEAFTPETMIWCQTANSGRNAWLATVRRADLPDGLMADALSHLTDREGVPALRTALEKGPLLHIAGGEDEQKGPFLTFYVSVDRAAISDFLLKTEWLESD